MTRPLRYGLALATVAVSGLTTAALWQWLAPTPSIIFIPAVLVSALYGGLGPGLLATGASVATLAYFFLPPYFSFSVGVADGVRLGIYLLTTLVITSLVSARREVEAAHQALTQELETRVRQRTEELVAAQQALIDARHLESVGRLAAGMAHEVNNALQVIVGASETLRRDSWSSPDNRQMTLLDEIQVGCARAATLVKQLLAFSRRQPLRPRPSEPETIVNRVTTTVRRRLPDHVRLEVASADALPLIVADADKLEIALLQLVNNARDAMPTGGVLKVSTSLVDVGPAFQVRHACTLPCGQYIEFAVADSGVGMSDVTARRIFEPFFTTKPFGNGQGLGLSMAYGTVKQSGGDILVETRPGSGSTFRVLLPASTA